MGTSPKGSNGIQYAMKARTGAFQSESRKKILKALSTSRESRIM